MASPMSSVNLSILSFALSSWLDGSAQLRRSLILFPLEFSGVHHDDEPSSSSQATTSSGELEQLPIIDRLLQWLTRPAKDMDEAGKAVLGALDVSSSVLLLRLLGSGPILPFILNPLSITLVLPRKLSIGPVKWSQVVLMCILLSILHEAQRTSVAAGLTWLRLKRTASLSENVGEIVIRGEKLEAHSEESNTEEVEECVICSGVGYDDPLPDAPSNSSSASSSVADASSLGPLEAFCVHAPAKHPMHRACFAAWKDAYWEGRAVHMQTRGPVIKILSEDAVVLLPGTWQWRRAQAILSSLGAGIANAAYFIPITSEEQPDVQTAGNAVGESVFTLRGARRGGAEKERDGEAALGSLVSTWPFCPGCRSAVKMVFARASAGQSAEECSGMLARMLRVWIRSWKQLISGRTILMKTATQILFAISLVSMMRIKRSHARHLLISRQVL